MGNKLGDSYDTAYYQSSIRILMAHESVEPRQKSIPAAVDQRDPQKITDLIEQLDRDLVETEKNTAKRQ